LSAVEGNELASRAAADEATDNRTTPDSANAERAQNMVEKNRAATILAR
jgi:hypothetical protein